MFIAVGRVLAKFGTMIGVEGFSRRLVVKVKNYTLELLISCFWLHVEEFVIKRKPR